MTDDNIAEKLRQAHHNDLTDVPLLIDAAEEIEQLQRKVERLQRERDDIHTLWLKCCSNSVALVHQHDELKAQNERLTYELKRWKEVEANRPDWEKLWGEQSEKADELKAQVERLLAKELGEEPTPPCDSDGPTSHQPAEGSPLPNRADHSEDR
jgi:hypothetical protein